jgi:hypothetical protein
MMPAATAAPLQGHRHHPIEEFGRHGSVGFPVNTQYPIRLFSFLTFGKNNLNLYVSSAFK